MGKFNGFMALEGLCCSAAIFLFTLLVSVGGHGRLRQPPSRSSMWRDGFKTEPNYNDMELFCGGFNVQWNDNGGQCGICGDPWGAKQPRENEIGGKYGKGIITKTYTQGQTIEVKVEITANHKGFFEFRICSADANPKVEVTQECLNRTILSLADGSGTKYYLPVGSGAETFTMSYKLPANLSCKRCVFQWIYTAGNNDGPCDDGTRKVGCGPQEQFRGCADVEILPSANKPTSGRRTTTSQTAPNNVFTTRKRPYYYFPRVTSTPSTTTTTTTQLPAIGGRMYCVGVGVWHTVPGMHVWCENNCFHVPSYCPQTHCFCFYV